jgi:hypothetical protein
MFRKSRRYMRLQAKRERCVQMRAAKERLRLSRDAEAARWEIVRVMTILDPQTGAAHRWILRAGPERRVSLEVDGRVARIGSERTFTAVLRRAMWRAAA